MGRTTPVKNTLDYRNIERLSYSALKQFEKDRKKFKLLYVDKDETAIRKEKEQAEKSDYIRMGNIVDILLTDEENFHDYFVEFTAEKPTGQMLYLCDKLYEITIEDMDKETHSVKTSFESRFERAYEDLKIYNGGKLKDSIEKFLENFDKKIGKDYFYQKLISYGKTIITSEERIMGEKIVESLKNSIGTREIVLKEGLTKFPILFEVGDVPFKMEADKIIIDHDEKVIYPYDFKVSSFVEGFVWDGFLDKKYYIQSGLYKYGIEQWKENTEFRDYKVENLAFVVCDQNNYYQPLVYKTTDQHYEQSWLGFFVGNKKYKGINQIIEELKETIEKNCWNISVENLRNKGIVYIPLFKSLENELS